MKKLFFVLVFALVASSLKSQNCPNLTFPVNGATNVPVSASISWNAILGVPGYIISIGTTAGGTDIVNEINVGSATTYTPILGLPENIPIYVTITLFFFNRPNITCASQTFTTEDVTSPPLCINNTVPINGANNINVETNISWDYVPSATGYRISIGTTSNGTEIINNLDIGNVLTFNPITNLPPSTDIYFNIIPYNENGPDPLCQEISFTTGAIATLPNCTSLISPMNGEINVSLSPFLEWNAIADAEGYRVSLGTSPLEKDILDDGIYRTNSGFVLDFEPNSTIFITIVPFNDVGEAIGCTQETFSTILGCGPYFDFSSEELTYLNPEIDFPNEIGICLDTDSTIYTATDPADGYRWYKIGANDSEILISSTAEVNFSELGEYRYEAYNTITQSGNTIECPTTKIFNVTISEAPKIVAVRAMQNSSGLRLETIVEGIGSYEYALDNIDGPYQDSNIFTGVPSGMHTIYVRDKNGCGIAEEIIEQDLTLENFPKFFTPNGDGINDFWQFDPPTDSNEISLDSILIFDRFGNLIANIDPTSRGWNGQFNGRPVPASDYWFKAISLENKEIKGHFSLKR